jgi:small conductance mechanosensitive channel
MLTGLLLWVGAMFSLPLLPEALLVRMKQASLPVQNQNKAVSTSQDKAAMTDADRISRLQRAIDANTERMAQLQNLIDKPSKEFLETERTFKQLDETLLEKKKELKKVPDDKKDEQARLTQEIDKLEKELAVVRDRFNQHLAERKIHMEKIENLKELIRLDQDALKVLMGEKKPPVEAEKVTAPPRTGTTETAGTMPPGKVPPAATLPAAGKKDTPPASTLPSTIPGMPTLPAVPSADPSVQTPATENPPNPELIKAKEVAKEKQAAAQQALSEAQSIQERIEILRKNISLERNLLESTRRQVDQEQKRHDDMVLEQEKMLQQNPHPEVWKEIWKKRSESANYISSMRKEMRRSAERLEVLQEELNQFQKDQLIASQKAQLRQSEAEDAEKKVEQLKNPFTLQNLQRWLYTHGLKILVILISMYLLRKFFLLFSSRIVSFVSKHNYRGSDQDRINRAETLVDVFRNTVSMLIIVSGIIMISDELGVPVAPLLGGAAMLGLAVAFGAQNLIRDYFTGFMVLLEDQYGIKDIVRIGTITGRVEKITLRMTMLRDIEGIVHFIPHGTITTVSNLTHGWSRALIEVTVAYKENVDRVIEILRELAIDLRKDAEFGKMIIEDPEMLGLETLGNFGVSIRFLVKTVPMQQWTIKRELHRRIKKKFDELGIEIPYPQQVVHYRAEEDEAQNSLGNGRPPRPIRTL